MKIIDSHVNISETNQWFNTEIKTDINEIDTLIKKKVIENAILLGIRDVASNNYLGELKSKTNYYIFGNLSSENFKVDFEQIQEYKLDGIKFHPRFQNESIKEWIDNGVFEHLNNYKVIINICGWLQSSSVYLNEISPELIDFVAKKYKNIRFIISHMFCYKYWDAFFLARSNRNIYLDTSYFLEFFKGTSLEKDFLSSINKIDQKVVFGSDYPEISIINSINTLSSMNLDSRVLENIFYNNINQLLNE